MAKIYLATVQRALWEQLTESSVLKINCPKFILLFLFDHLLAKIHLATVQQALWPDGICSHLQLIDCSTETKTHNNVLLYFHIKITSSLNVIDRSNLLIVPQRSKHTIIYFTFTIIKKTRSLQMQFN